MKSKYQLMSPSSVAFDTSGVAYPDLATFSPETFSPVTKPNAYQMTEQDVYRFDILTRFNYGQYTYYDDMTMWFNEIPFMTEDSNVGQFINLYTKDDLDTFYATNLK